MGERTLSNEHDGKVKCWGSGGSGRLGYGDTYDGGDHSGEMGTNLSVVNFGTGKTVKQISSGQHHSCAILNDDTIFAEEEQSEGDFHELVKKLKTLRYNGMRKVVHLAIGFFFLFAAYNTIQNYVTTLLPGCLGFSSLCVLYVSVCPSLLLAPGICSRIGDKWTLVIGAVCYSVWIASLTRPENPILVIGASVIIGFGAAILWVAQGTYLTKQGDETNRGRLAGTFWGIFQLSGIVGNIGSYFVINRSSSDDTNDDANNYNNDDRTNSR